MLVYLRRLPPPSTLTSFVYMFRTQVLQEHGMAWHRFRAALATWDDLTRVIMMAADDMTELAIWTHNLTPGHRTPASPASAGAGISLARFNRRRPNRTAAPTDRLPSGGEGLVRLVRPPGAAFNPMSECGNQLDALSDTEKPATA
ncbi:hypothetical protein CFIO01_08135 [Colletotrichum fioriniae PJ7]|uniref:Uncharacterized protein n=1 Tax=Colletotrichum fioriniae PJ7 TaxID=1445577 RepID=A0A010RVR7_9PEZI|nr:hypothetical protein CFIO01_08135 [Colletotrichum fioriniae PJ7]